MASVEKDSEAETESVAAKSGKEMSSKERDAETEAQDLKQLASEALKAMQNKTTMSADSMSKSPSTEILENYNQQPLHVRSRAEQWELPRSVSSLNHRKLYSVATVRFIAVPWVVSYDFLPLPRYQEIQLTDKLGEGDGGVIYHAHWRGLDVVAKMLKADTDR